MLILQRSNPKERVREREIGSVRMWWVRAWDWRAHVLFVSLGPTRHSATSDTWTFSNGTDTWTDKTELSLQSQLPSLLIINNYNFLFLEIMIKMHEELCKILSCFCWIFFVGLVWFIFLYALSRAPYMSLSLSWVYHSSIEFQHIVFSPHFLVWQICMLT